MVTETIKRSNGYHWFVYSQFGSPLRDIIASGICETKDAADNAADEALRYATSKGLK